MVTSVPARVSPGGVYFQSPDAPPTSELVKIAEPLYEKTSPTPSSAAPASTAITVPSEVPSAFHRSKPFPSPGPSGREVELAVPVQQLQPRSWGIALNRRGTRN